MNYEITAYGTQGTKGRRYSLATKETVAMAIQTGRLDRSMAKAQTGCCDATLSRWLRDFSTSDTTNVEKQLGAVSRRPGTSIPRTVYTV